MDRNYLNFFCGLPKKIKFTKKGESTVPHNSSIGFIFVSTLISYLRYTIWLIAKCFKALSVVVLLLPTYQLDGFSRSHVGAKNHVALI